MSDNIWFIVVAGCVTHLQGCPGGVMVSTLRYHEEGLGSIPSQKKVFSTLCRTPLLFARLITDRQASNHENRYQGL